MGQLHADVDGPAPRVASGTEGTAVPLGELREVLAGLERGVRARCADPDLPCPLPAGG